MAARYQLEIVIVGAGLAGLAASISCALAGHRVVVLEGARQLAEVRLESQTRLLFNADNRTGWSRPSDHTQRLEATQGMGS